MNIDHVHFYVEDASTWRDWFINTLGFQPIASLNSWHTRTEIVQSGSVYILLSSARTVHSPVAGYLQSHPPGVADLAFQVADLAAAIAQAEAVGARVLRLSQNGDGCGLKWAEIQGWGDLRHTLIESDGSWTDRAAIVRLIGAEKAGADADESVDPGFFDQESGITGIDHAVLNVETGDLERAIAWYEEAFGFRRQQAFEIQTPYSGLCSRVLRHPDGTAQLPINEPASPKSQIQEFLEDNRGSGIQHIALQTHQIVQTIAQLRQRGLAFLSVPFSYYEQLRHRPGFRLQDQEWDAIVHQEVLVDWQDEYPQGLLLQTFTQPIFPQPTFFFELIERRKFWQNQQHRQAQGFGEGNFQALFEAIEREQIKRGTLLSKYGSPPEATR